MQMAFLGAGLTTVSDVGVDWVFWLAAGGIAAATAQRASAPAVAASPRRARPGTLIRSSDRKFVAAACVAAGILLALNSAWAFAASRAAKESQLQRFGGHPQAAVDAGLRATQLDSQRPEYWDALGLAYVTGDRVSDAAAAFRRTVALAPYNVAFLGDLASAYLLAIQRGDVSAGVQARQVVDQAVRIDPNNPQASLTRALVMQATGDLKEAVVSVERALELDQSNNPQILLTATKVYLANGRPEDAIAVARPAVSLLGKLPSSVPIRIELARALAAIGQRAQALVELDAALAIRPNDPTALQLKAQIQQGQSQ
jgi:tetratricopeptide (TPR) repeat protein